MGCGKHGIPKDTKTYLAGFETADPEESDMMAFGV